MKNDKCKKFTVHSARCTVTTCYNERYGDKMTRKKEEMWKRKLTLLPTYYSLLTTLPTCKLFNLSTKAMGKTNALKLHIALPETSRQLNKVIGEMEI